MTSDKKKKSTQVVSEIQAPIPTYNELRRSVMDEINTGFNVKVIEESEIGRDVSITKLLEEIKKDLAIPNSVEELANYNLGIGLLMNKYTRDYVKFIAANKKLKHKLEVLEAKITQEYKRNPEINNRILLDSKEIKNLIIINPEHIALIERINNIETIIDVYNRALNQINSISFHVNNSITLLKISHQLQ